MSLLGDLLLAKTRSAEERQNNINYMQAQGLISAMGKQNPDGSPVLDAEHLSAAQDQLNKLVGTTKEGKGLVQQFSGLVQKLHGHAHQQAGTQPGAGDQGNPQGAGAGAPPPGDAGGGGAAAQGGQAGPSSPAGSSTPLLPPPPTPATPASSAATAPDAAAAMSTPMMPPPPPPGASVGAGNASPAPSPAGAPASPPPSSSFAQIMSRAGTPRSPVPGTPEATRAELAERDALASAAGLRPGTRDYQEFKSTGKFPVASHLQAGSYIDSGTGEEFFGSFDPSTGQITDNDGAVRQATRKATAADASGAVKVMQPSGGGAPYALFRNNKTVKPGDAGWTDADQKTLDAAKASYEAGDEAKTHREMVVAQAREKMYQASRLYGEINNDTGQLVSATPGQVASAPEGTYSPAAQGLQVKKALGVFNEIDTAKGILNDALAGMSDDQFNTEQRLQVAYALRSNDPSSALSSFLTSSVARGLSDQQVQYLTALASMQESAMALRTVAGMGAGSDKLRGAIEGMLPGASTPTKQYALRQMQLFDKEVNALKTTLPKMGNAATPNLPGLPPPTRSSGAAAAGGGGGGRNIVIN